MIALVISIIVMLILAGVSISAIVGEDGVLTKAKAASIASRKASILEELNMELASYNIDAILKSPEQTTTMLGNLISKGLIDTVLSSSEKYVAEATSPMGIPQFDDANNYTGYIDYAVKKEDYSIIISIDDSGIYKAEYGEVTISAGGSVAGGTTLVTDKAFTNNEGATAEEQGKFTIDNDASVMFVDEINGELSIQVKSGKHAKVYAFKDMTLTNSGIKRSAIDIEPGGTLDLFVSEGATVTVNSGLGEGGTDATASMPGAAPGGPGGYAGIHLPIGANLILQGKGKIIAYGGNAGDGGLCSSSISSGGRGAGGGGGAGAGIGGNGGPGGSGNYSDSYKKEGGIGQDGEKGESCGDVLIKDSIEVIAYGGAGGSGGGTTAAAGGGGGGYPAAGIGGGGAGGGGGDHVSGGGGFTGGENEYNSTGSHAINGLAGTANAHDGRVSGGGYFEAANIASTDSLGGFKGGGGGANKKSSWYFSYGGDGGTAGLGGNIVISTEASTKLKAYNGSYITDNKQYSETTCTNIYAQSGCTLPVIKNVGYWSDSKNEYYSNLFHITVNYQTNYTTYRQVTMREALTSDDISTTIYGQGIGSGAGYIEVSNGTYTVDPNMN